MTGGWTRVTPATRTTARSCTETALADFGLYSSTTSAASSRNTVEAITWSRATNGLTLMEAFKVYRSIRHRNWEPPPATSSSWRWRASKYYEHRQYDYVEMSHLELNFSFSYKSNIECTNFTRVCTRHQTKTKHVKHSFHTCRYTFLCNTEIWCTHRHNSRANSRSTYCSPYNNARWNSRRWRQKRWWWMRSQKSALQGLVSLKSND